MIDKAELRQMSQADRRQLAMMLAELDEPAASPFQQDPVLRRERRLALLVAAGCCVILAGWIVLLAATLPHHFDAHHWRAVWVNFDVFLLAAFAATAWAIWRERQVLILLLMVIGTMLFCDAWFDVGTSLATSGFWISLLSALFAELPLAFLAFAGARQLLRATVAAAIAAGATAPARDTSGRRDSSGRRGSVASLHSAVRQWPGRSAAPQPRSAARRARRASRPRWRVSLTADRRRITM